MVTYAHPIEYGGVMPNTPTNQTIVKEYVELNCLKCDMFCGREHNFAECKRAGIYDEDCTCPDACRRLPSLVNPCVSLSSQ